MIRFAVSAIAIAATMALAAPAARADAIDGKWCNGARSFQINGPAIILPSGASHQGTYDRHGFDYVAPDSEADGGDSIQMALQSEDLLHLRRTPKGSGETGPIERWQRCANLS